MKFLRVFCIYILVFFLATYGYSQSDVSLNNIDDIVVHGDDIWCCTRSGLVCWDSIDMTYKSYTKADGLAVNEIKTIVFDKNDDMWIGTWGGGVQHFDGNEWKTYTEKDGLGGLYIYSMAIAQNGSVWAGTYRCGVSCFDGEKWTTYKEEDGLAGNYRCLITISNDGTVWVGSNTIEDYNTGLLSYYDGQSWKQYISEEFKPEYQISTVEIDLEGALWVGTKGSKLFKYDGEKWTKFTSSDYKIIYSPKDIAKGPDGKIWVAASEGITCYDGETWTAIYDILLPSNNSRTIAVDSNGIVWVGTWIQNGGLVRYDGEKWDIFRIEDTIADNSVNALTFGKNGDIWAGTDYGLSRYDGETWNTYTTADGLSQNIITALATGPDGSIWAGTTGVDGAELTRFDGTEWTIHTDKDIMSNTMISAIAVDAEGIVWIGTIHREGFRETKKIYGTVSWYDSHTWNSHEVTLGADYNGVTSIAMHPDGDVWIGTLSGVLRYDGNIWTGYTVENGLLGEQVEALDIGQDGKVWAGICGRGISCFDGQSWYTVVDDNTDIPDINIMDVITISSMVVDNNCVLWVGSYCGNVISYDGKEFKTFIDKNGDTIPEVTSIAVCEKGVLFGTPRGIYRYGYVPGIYKVIVPSTTVNVELNHMVKHLLPEKFELYENYPNPFNPSTTITYTIKDNVHTVLSVYNSNGQNIRTLVDTDQSPGTYAVQWDGTDDSGMKVSSGLYIYKIHAGKFAKSMKMLFVQ